jgi:transcriptional regulator with XRE-family HTH domain
LTSRKLPVIIANMASDPLTLGMQIRRARERKRLSQEELAAKVGASERAVNDWENDRRKPRNRIGALEEVLGVSLTGEPGEPETATPEEIERLREHIREVLGEDSELEAAMDDVVARKPAPGPRGGGASGRSARRRAVRWSG